MPQIVLAGLAPSAIRTLAAQGIEVLSINDLTSVPHNGCRPPKRKRM